MTLEALSIAIAIIGLIVTIMGGLLRWSSGRITSLETEIKELRRDYVRRDDADQHWDAVKDEIADVKANLKDLSKLVIVAIQDRK